METKRKKPLNKKRYGEHHKRSKRYHHVYLPYLPMVIMLILSFLLSGYRPAGSTLAYATEMSKSGLLASTNSERAKVNAGSLTLNQALVNAAQAKANDMVARNYWSHNTPDGQEPWVFFDNAGYEYTKAGENLAYGFLTSSATVNGWMNSASHKANMLDSEFTEVGFGFANSDNFNGSGQETVVVAEYGRPQVLGSVAQASTPPTPPAAPPIKKASPSAKPNPVPSPTPTPQLSPTPAPTAPVEKSPTPPPAQPITSNTDPIVVAAAPTRNISRVEQLFKNNGAMAAGILTTVTLVALALMLFKHGLLIHQFIRKSERLILHHPLFDSTMIGVIVFALTLLRTVGAVK